MLGELIQKLKAQGHAAFIPYVMAGDATLEDTQRYVTALISAGADIIELGVPFSDPMADGPTNQLAAERALKNGTSLKDILGFVETMRLNGNTIPIVLFTYYNPVFKMGIKEFAEQAERAGVDGILSVDLPPEEAGDYCRILGEKKIETVFLASPTTTDERLRLIDQKSTGFVYYVSRTGVTGAQAELSKSLGSEIERVKRFVKNPLAVGFGISTPEQAATVGKLADGVVVGSALVKLIEKNPVREAEKKIRALASSMVEAIQPPME